METTVNRGQSLLDKVLETTGSIDNLFEMAMLNNISLTHALPVGTVLQASPVTNKAVVKLWNKNNLPATLVAVSATETGDDYLIPGIFPQSL